MIREMKMNEKPSTELHSLRLNRIECMGDLSSERELLFILLQKYISSELHLFSVFQFYGSSLPYKCLFTIQCFFGCCVWLESAMHRPSQNRQHKIGTMLQIHTLQTISLSSKIAWNARTTIVIFIFIFMIISLVQKYFTFYTAAAMCTICLLSAQSSNTIHWLNSRPEPQTITRVCASFNSALFLLQ